MMKVVSLISIILLIAFQSVVFAQELPLLLEKTGSFEVLNRTDYAASDCNFTKADITSNLQRINEMVNIVRKNQVLSTMKGFDGRARIYNSLACQYGGLYGVPARISFEFAAWFKNKDGREARGLIEPPEWSVHINNIQPGWTSGFSRKPDFFAVPDNKETIAPGIDVYDGECFVLYNPDRPDYWLPVTVKEAFDAVFAENTRVSDQIQRDFVLNSLKEEWEAIPQEDWNKPATMSGMISRVGTLEGYPKIMKANPVYWDKSRPKSDIQFITFRMITNKEFLSQRTQEYLKNNSISYHCARFEKSLDMDFVRSLVLLVGK